MMYTFGETIHGSDVTVFEHNGEISITVVEKYKDKNKIRRSRRAQCWIKGDTALKISKLLTEWATTKTINHATN